MKKNSFILKIDPKFVLCLLIYLGLGVFLIKYYQYQINPDGISYISIAQKYLRGDFVNAINGYWGPLFSWLLMPFLFFGLPPLFATKFLSLLIGLMTLIGMRLLSYRFEMTERIRSIISFSLIPIILFFSFYTITPDLLTACLLIYYFNLIFNKDYPDKKYKGILCGAIAGLAYLGKSYFFPFCISHFLLFNIFHYFRNVTKEKKKGVLLNLFVGLAIFFIISGSWISIISAKYGQLTIGTAGKAAYAFVSPQSQDAPMRWPGFIKPPNETATSFREDLSYIKLNSWSPMQSWVFFKHQSKLIFQNTYYIILTFQSFSILSVVIIIAYILICIRSSNKIFLENDEFYPLVTIGLYSAGYALLFIEARYFWIICLLLILMGGRFLSMLFKNDFFTETRKKVIILFFAVSFMVMPLKGLMQNINTDKDIYILSKALKDKCNIQGNIASSNTLHNPYDTMHKSLYISYHLNSRYYGEADNNIGDMELISELKKNKINYLFTWSEPEDGQRFLSDDYHGIIKEKIHGEAPGLTIYSLKKDE